MSNGIFGYDAGEREVTTMSFNSRLTPEEVIAELKKFPDREPIVVLLGANTSVIISLMYPITDVEDGSREQVQN